MQSLTRYPARARWLSLTAWLLLGAGCERLAATVQIVSVLSAAPGAGETLPSELQTLAAFQNDPFLDTTTALVSVLERDSATSQQVAGLGGARVTLRWGQERIILCETGQDAAGVYASSSFGAADQTCHAPTLSYAPGEVYRTDVETHDEVYSVSVKAPPPIALDEVQFAPALTGTVDLGGVAITSHDGGDLKLTWKDAEGADERHALVTVVRVQLVGDLAADPASVFDAASWQVDPANPVFTNAPQTTQDYIDLVLEAPATGATIPAATFDAPGIYAAIISLVTLSNDGSTNVSVASGALAGQGVATTFFVGP